MPPKSTISKNCTGRDINDMSAMAKKQIEISGVLAQALENDTFLAWFAEEGVAPNLNECMMSFMSNDKTIENNWFGVYLEDINGNQYTKDPMEDSSRIAGKTLYVQVLNINGHWHINPDNYTFDKPAELNSFRNCGISNSNKCVVSVGANGKPAANVRSRINYSSAGTSSSSSSAGPSTSYQTAPQVTSITQAKRQTQSVENRTSETPVALNPAVQQLMENLSQPTQVRQGPKLKHPREYFEKMDLNHIINWVAENMYPEDLLKCVRGGTLSEQEEAAVNNLETQLTAGQSGTGAGPSGASHDEDEDTRNIAQQMKPSQLNKMVEKISKEHIIEELNMKHPDKNSDSYFKDVRDLCNGILTRSGSNELYQVTRNKTTGKLTLKDQYGTPVQVNNALKICAASQASYMKRLLLNAGKIVSRGSAKWITQTRKNKVNKVNTNTSIYDKKLLHLMSIKDEETKINEVIKALKEDFNLDYTQFKGMIYPPGHHKNADFVLEADEAISNYEELVNEKLAEEQDTTTQPEEQEEPIVKQMQSLNIKEPELLSKIGGIFKKVLDEPDLSKRKLNIINLCKFARLVYKLQNGNIVDGDNNNLSDLDAMVNFMDASIKETPDGYFSTTTNEKLSNEEIENIGILIELKAKSSGFGKKRKSKGNVFSRAAKICKGKSNYRKCFVKTIRKLHSSGFGKKSKKSVKGKKNVFSRAAKMCKGKSNYRKCFVKTIRKLHSSGFGKKSKSVKSTKRKSTKRKSVKSTKRKSVKRKSTKRKIVKRKSNKGKSGKILKKYTESGNRKSPGISATTQKIGTIKEGLDGNLWKIKKTVTGIKRWVKV